MLLGSMEAGGTKMVLCIGDEEQHIFERETISTTSPEETMEKILAFFRVRAFARWESVRLARWI